MSDKRLQTFPFLATCLLWLLVPPAMARSESVSLLLEDETGPVSTLEVGRTLSARVSGLGSGQTVLVTLRDHLLWPVVSATAMADSNGEVVVAPLWQATGIVGCDCLGDARAYVFPRAESALQTLVGRVFQVTVEDALVGTLLATTNLPLSNPISPIAFPADASGCPRYHLQDAEGLHLLVLGGPQGASTDVTLAPGNGPIVEVRSTQPEGPTFSLSGSGFEVILLWPGSLTSPGNYRLVVGGSGWPAQSNLGGGPINSGVVVEDHSCPPGD